MLPRTALRASKNTSAVARRNFHSTPLRKASPYHYDEGPRSNIPFNPKSKWFPLQFWGFAFTGFTLPFGIAVWQTYKNK